MQDLRYTTIRWVEVEHKTYDARLFSDPNRRHTAEGVLILSILSLPSPHPPLDAFFYCSLQIMEYTILNECLFPPKFDPEESYSNWHTLWMLASFPIFHEALSNPLYSSPCFRMNNNTTTMPWRCIYHNCWLKHDGAASDWWSLLWGPQVRETQRRHSYAFLSQPTHMSSDSENIFNQISDLKLYSAHVLQNGPREMFLITKTRQETICWN